MNKLIFTIHNDIHNYINQNKRLTLFWAALPFLFAVGLKVNWLLMFWLLSIRLKLDCPLVPVPNRSKLKKSLFSCCWFLFMVGLSYCFVFICPGPMITFFCSTFFVLFAFSWMKLLIFDLGSSLYPGSTKTGLNCSYC